MNLQTGPITISGCRRLAQFRLELGYVLWGPCLLPYGLVLILMEGRLSLYDTHQAVCERRRVEARERVPQHLQPGLPVGVSLEDRLAAVTAEVTW